MMTCDVQKGAVARTERSVRIDLWISNPGELDAETRRRLESLISSDERLRLERIAVQKGRDQFLASRALLRTTLSRYVRRDPRDWQFVKNNYGRPYLARGQTRQPLHFSVSHTVGLLIVGISEIEHFGVDVEFVNPGMNYLSLARAAFADAEVLKLANAKAKERCELFFSLWTLKEAYVKARGAGFAIPPALFSIESEGSLSRIRFSPGILDDSEMWHFRRCSPTRQHRAAIAVRTSPDHPILVRSYNVGILNAERPPPSL